MAESKSAALPLGYTPKSTCFTALYGRLTGVSRVMTVLENMTRMAQTVNEFIRSHGAAGASISGYYRLVSLGLRGYSLPV